MGATLLVVCSALVYLVFTIQEKCKKSQEGMEQSRTKYSHVHGQATRGAIIDDSEGKEKKASKLT
jgi:hypothetical protein